MLRLQQHRTIGDSGAMFWSSVYVECFAAVNIHTTQLRLDAHKLPEFLASNASWAKPVQHYRQRSASSTENISS